MQQRERGDRHSAESAQGERAKNREAKRGRLGWNSKANSGLETPPPFFILYQNNIAEKKQILRRQLLYLTGPGADAAYGFGSTTDVH